MEQLRQEQLELAQAPVPAIAPTSILEEAHAPTSAPDSDEELSAPAEVAPRAAEAGEAQLAEPGEGEVGLLETETVQEEEEEVAVGRPSITEESRKRKESMKNNAEQVL